MKEILPYITRSFYSMRWQDVLDIFVVAFVIYHFILMLKGTRAFRMLVGLVVIVLVTILSQWLKLQTLNWLFSNFWQMGIIILVILFQPELRKALAQVGTTPFYLGATMREEMVLREIVDASYYLATKKIGALIVLEREMGLKNYIDSGIRINASKDVTKGGLIPTIYEMSQKSGKKFNINKDLKVPLTRNLDNFLLSVPKESTDIIIEMCMRNNCPYHKIGYVE